MDTLDFILTEFNLNSEARRMPIEIPDIGRDSLARLFVDLGYRFGVELGVERGLYSEVLCKANPDLHLYSVDSWQHYEGYRDHVDQNKFDSFYAAAQERMGPYSCELVRKFGKDAAQDFRDASLDFVYIDANHSLPYVIEDIMTWLPKIKPGGIISGHDYRKTKNNFALHVVQAVNAYTDAYKVRPWFVLGRKDMIEGEIRDTHRSWMWVV